MERGCLNMNVPNFMAIHEILSTLGWRYSRGITKNTRIHLTSKCVAINLIEEIHPLGNMNVCTKFIINPFTIQFLLRHFTQSKDAKPHSVARGKVRGSLKSAGFPLWGTWMSWQCIQSLFRYSLSFWTKRQPTDWQTSIATHSHALSMDKNKNKTHSQEKKTTQ